MPISFLFLFLFSFFYSVHESFVIKRFVLHVCSDLQLDYVDLFLVHWPLQFKKGTDVAALKPGDAMAIDQKKLWQEMESCVDAGLTRSIGVSNWSIKKLDELLAIARIPPAVNQVPLCSKPSLAMTSNILEIIRKPNFTVCTKKSPIRFFLYSFSSFF